VEDRVQSAVREPPFVRRRALVVHARPPLQHFDTLAIAREDLRWLLECKVSRRFPLVGVDALRGAGTRTESTLLGCCSREEGERTVTASFPPLPVHLGRL
jgi:hypothetical protein